MIALVAPGQPPWHDPGWLVAIGTMTTAILGAVGSLVVMLMKQRGELQRLGAKVEVTKMASAEAASSAASAATEAASASSAAAAARDQVQNTHTTNLRDDLDQKNAEVLDAIHRLGEQYLLLQREIEGVRDDMRNLTASAHSAHEQLHARIDQITDRCDNC